MRPKSNVASFHLFPRLSNEYFINSIPVGIETVEYVINLNGYNHLIAAKTPDEWEEGIERDNSKQQADTKDTK